MRSNLLPLRTALLAALVFPAACSSPIGERFADVDAIGMSDTWRDWVIVGSFGPGGPFELTEIKACEIDEPCSFSHNGQSHTYERFYGYQLTVLRLEGPHDEVSHVVLRSRTKYPDDT